MRLELTPEVLRAYRDRPWDRARASKEAFWAAEARVRGPIAGLEASTAMWEHTRSIDPSWPSAEARRADLDHHIRWAQMLRRLADVFARR